MHRHATRPSPNPRIPGEERTKLDGDAKLDNRDQRAENTLTARAEATKHEDDDDDHVVVRRAVLEPPEVTYSTRDLQAETKQVGGESRDSRAAVIRPGVVVVIPAGASEEGASTGEAELTIN